MRKHRMRKVTTSVVDWLNCIWLTDLPPNAKYIACYLRKFMNSNQDMAWPSYARMIEETGLGRATVAKYLKLLDSEGWIQRERESGENTTYIATLPKPIEDGVKKLGSSIAELVREPNYTSSGDEPLLVREPNTNKQVNKQVNKQERKRKVFVKPSSEDVQAYFEERGLREYGIGERFVDHYESNGWMVGRNKMKDWKAAVRTWVSKRGIKPPQKPTEQPKQDKRKAEEQLEMMLGQFGN